MCPANLLTQQVQHAVVLAGVVALHSTIALALDLFATKLGKLGATEETVRELRRVALVLFRFDLWFVLVFALVQVALALRCVAGL